MRHTIFLILIFLSLKSAGQETKFQKNIGWKGSSIELKSFSNFDKSQTCVFLHKSESLKGYLFDKNIKLLKEFEAGAFIDENIVGGFITENKVTVVAQNKYTHNFHTYVFGIADNSYNQYFMDYNLKGKKVLGTINAGNDFYCINAEKKEPVLSVTSFKVEGELKEFAFNMSEILGTKYEKRDLWNALTVPAGLGRELDIVVVEDGIECDVDNANARNKIYFRGDSLLLLMDDSRGVTQVFTFNLNSKVSKYRKISTKLPVLASEAMEFDSFNSFLVDNLLYYVFASSGELTLSIADFDTGIQKSSFKTLAQDSITYKNTPVMQEGSSFLSSEKRELTKTKQLIRKMRAGTAVIAGLKNLDNQHEITIGAYKKIQTGGGGPMMMGGVAGGFAMASGMYMRVGYSGSWGRTTRFKTLIDPKTGEHVQGEITIDINKIIEDASVGINAPTSGTDVCRLATGLYYAFYSRDDKKFSILKMQ